MKNTFKLFGAAVVMAVVLFSLAACKETEDDDYGTSATYYTVTFYANGGYGTVPPAQRASSGSSITLPSGDGLSKSGYTFGGWRRRSTGNLSVPATAPGGLIPLPIIMFSWMRFGGRLLTEY